MRGIACLLVFAGLTAVAMAEEVPQAVVDFANASLKAIGEDPIIVAGVQAENAKGKTLAQIQETDEKWRAEAGVTPFMTEMMKSPVAQRLLDIQKGAAFYAEIFVTDNQGANVAMTDKTSDYWQGDEPKFTESFKGGAGAIHIGDVAFDPSTQAYLVQVSVPVMDAGKAVGTITFGIDLDRFQ